MKSNQFWKFESFWYSILYLSDLKEHLNIEVTFPPISKK